MSYVIAKIKSQVKLPFEIYVFGSPIAALALKRLKQWVLEFYKKDFINEYSGNIWMWHADYHEVFSYQKLTKAKISDYFLI